MEKEKYNENMNSNNKNNSFYKDRINIRIKNIKLKKKLCRSFPKSYLFKKNNNINQKVIDNNNLKLSKTFQLKNINFLKIKKFIFKAIFPIERRIKSCILLSSNMNECLTENNSIVNNKKLIININKSTNNNNKNKENEYKIYNLKPKNFSAYYYSGSLPIKNKYIMDIIPQNKSLTSYYFKKNNINNTYKKIDNLAKTLNLFHREKILYRSNLSYKKSLRQSLSGKIYKLYKKDFINNKLDKKFTQSSNESHLHEKKYSGLAKTDTIITKETDIKNKKEKNISINDLKTKNFLKENKKNNKTLKYNDSEYLYKKIFSYNKEKKKAKGLNFIDNKLNLLYCENDEQYFQKMKKINNYFFKKGKPIKHSVISQDAKIKTLELINKINFMKKVVDYIYPKMVLDRVKEEKKLIYKSKSLDLKITASKLLLLKIKEKQQQVDSFLGKSLSLIK